jgi:hypothetical protein
MKPLFATIIIIVITGCASFEDPATIKRQTVEESLQRTKQQVAELVKASDKARAQGDTTIFANCVLNMA